MNHFVQLYTQLDQTTKTNEKVNALVDYFRTADQQDKLWTIAILSHRRPKRTVKTTDLRTWASEWSGIPLWLLEDSYYVVGDLAETLALVLPAPQTSHSFSFTYWIEFIKGLAHLNEEEKKISVIQAWQQLDTKQRFIFNKLITGGFRVGVSQQLITKALAIYSGVEEASIAHRLMGDWSPASIRFEELISQDNVVYDASKPYPFFLAYPLEEAPTELGNVEEWIAERKWDGIRGQLIVRNQTLYVWSRGEELLTARFPEFSSLATILPHGTVIDGEILPFKAGKPLPFQVLQTRIGRKTVSKKVLEEAPIVMIAYDLLEWEGKDIRALPLTTRRLWLEQLLNSLPNPSVLLCSEILPAQSWEELIAMRLDSRTFESEGLMLKRKNSTYQTGRRRGDWWKWKIDPMTIDAVMIYAQRGSGRRANLYTDYTFGVWEGEQLIPFTKAYSGLTDKEFNEVTQWVRQNTLERFGPVRSVRPTLVFELAFEGIQVSTRHKSGIALRFPRIVRWRRDKTAKEANTIADLKKMLNQDKKGYSDDTIA